ncbi:MAG: DUF4129 domain-containing protein [Blastocatellia bacterium]
MTDKLLSIRFRFLLAALLLLWLIGSGLPVFAAASVKEYAGRLRQAEQLTDQLIDGQSQASQIVATMSVIKQLVPAQEDVELDGHVIRVNNAWLHEAIALIIKNAYGDEEQIRSMLIELADRLLLLEQSVNTSLPDAASSTQDQSTQLGQILARPEYLPEEQKESTIKKWTKRLWAKIVELLARLFAGRSAPAGSVGAGSANLVRIGVILILLAAASIGLVKLLKRLRRRQKNDGDDAREVLGEELPENATAADLLANANQLARAGDFRSAIRRAYISLLCELEQRGKVRLHRSKTNRDYLDELKPQQSLYPTFSVMTGAFEHVWYGHESATENEFNDFLTLYKETIN